jgi:hypothetical protein
MSFLQGGSSELSHCHDIAKGMSCECAFFFPPTRWLMAVRALAHVNLCNAAIWCVYIEAFLPHVHHHCVPTVAVMCGGEKESVLTMEKCVPPLLKSLQYGSFTAVINGRTSV